MNRTINNTLPHSWPTDSLTHTCSCAYINQLVKQPLVFYPYNYTVHYLLKRKLKYLIQIHYTYNNMWTYKSSRSITIPVLTTIGVPPSQLHWFMIYWQESKLKHIHTLPHSLTHTFIHTMYTHQSARSIIVPGLTSIGVPPSQLHWFMIYWQESKLKHIHTLPHSLIHTCIYTMYPHQSARSITVPGLTTTGVPPSQLYIVPSLVYNLLTGE